MTRQLSQEALNEILSNPRLYIAICDSLDVKPVSLPKLVQRNANSLNTHDIVLMIAAAMEKEPDEILVDSKETA